MTLTSQLATLITQSQPSEEAYEKARTGLLDFITVIMPVIQGKIEDSGYKHLQQVYRANDPQSYALRLGYAGHALDFDDFHPDFRGHPSTVILPALFALATTDPTISGERFLDAYIIGVEMAGRLGLAIGSQHYTLGFHNTATLGTLAAAAACARLVMATATQTAMILAMAATQAAGLRAQFGSDAKPLHAGLAASTAVSATLLIQAGFRGQAEHVLEAFLNAYGAGEQRPDKLIADWGNPWRIIQPGLEFKPWPTCGGTHGAAYAAQILRDKWLKQGHTPEKLLTEVSQIEVAFPPGGDIAAAVIEPHNGIEARFSLEYVIAASLMCEVLQLSDFSAAPVDPQLAMLARRVKRCPDITAPADAINPAARFHHITLFLRNGETWQQRVTRQETVAKPIDTVGKMRICLPYLTEQKREEIRTIIRLESHDGISRLLALLAIIP